MSIDNGGYREREIGQAKKIGVTIWLFSALFAVVIIAGSTRPESFYIGIFFLVINMATSMIFIMWWVATKMDNMVGKVNEG